jgi:hypothetical protein
VTNDVLLKDGRRFPVASGVTPLIRDEVATRAAIVSLDAHSGGLPRRRGTKIAFGW